MLSLLFCDCSVHVWAPSFNSSVVWQCGNCSGNNSNGRFIQCLYPLALGTLIMIIIMIIIKRIFNNDNNNDNNKEDF